MYPKSWAISPGQQRKFGRQWIRSRVRRAHEHLNKPVYLGEFDRLAGNRADSYWNWYDTLDRTDADGALFWGLTTRGYFQSGDPHSFQPDEEPRLADAIQSFSDTADEKSGGGGFSRSAPSSSGGGPVGDGVHKVINAKSGKLLTVAHAQRHNGANVRQWSDGGWKNQQWRLVDEGNNTYRLKATHSWKALDVAGSQTHNGANVHVWEDFGTGNQRFRIEHIGNGKHKIKANHSGKVLEIPGNQTHDGANVQQWNYNGGDHQHWRFEPV